MSSSLIAARASYKKLQGLLELTDSDITWTQDGKKDPTVRVPRSQAASLFSSKEGTPQVKLKIGLVDDDTGHTFTFTSPQPTALIEREKFKSDLTVIVGQNRTIRDAQAAAQNGSASTPKPTLPTSGTPRPPLPSSVQPHASTSRAASVSSNAGTPGPQNDPINDFRLRKKVLVKTPELAALHRELVMTRQISEAEFWEGREHLLLAQAASDAQKKGRPGQLVDPRPQTVDGGEIKIVVTPQLVHDIFEEYPVVSKAYSENVPSKLSEADFWKRYFQSKLFSSHQASIRSTAAQHVVKDDPIFDKYLERPDDELEPRRQRDEDVEMFIDLGATNEDHGEAWSEKDVTMQAGKQRGALPLIRKFNEHSERLLKASGSEGPSSKRRRIDPSSGTDSRYSEIDLPDLHDPESSAGILLQMQDRQRYFEGRTGSIVAAEQNARPAVDVRAALQAAKSDLRDWSNNLGQLKLDRKATDSAVLSMTQNVAARLDVKSRKNDIPDDIFRQMSTCQTAANEFLRQFWSAIYPSASNAETLAPSTPAQKADKAARMAGYLGKTHEKVAAIVVTAHKSGVDMEKIEIAMKPILDAVDKALAFWSSRKPT